MLIAGVIFSLECVFVTAFFGAPLLSAAFLFIAASMLFMIARRKYKENRPIVADGWVLSEGVEISDPDNLQKIKNVVLHQKALNLGTLSTGSPGGGKTESVSLGLLHHCSVTGRGWAYFDGKGQKDVYQKSVAAGIQMDKFFSVVEEYPSHTINLMQSCDTHSLIERLITVLIGHGGEVYYANEQKQALMRVVPVLCSIGFKVNLPDLFVVLTNEKAGYEVISHAKAKGLDSGVISLAESWFNQDIHERTGMIKGMLNKLLPLVVDPVLSNRINNYHPDIELEKDINSSKGLYFHLPYSDKARQIAIMMIEEMAAIAAKRQVKGVDDFPEFHQVYDDWGKMVHANFTAYTSRARSAKMPPHFTFQSPAQLDEVSPTFRNEIDDTVSVKIIMRVMSKHTAKMAKELIGSYETHDMSRSVTEQRGDAYNIMSTQVDRIKEEDFYELDAGQAIVATSEYQAHTCKTRRYKVQFPLLDTDGWKDVEIAAPEIQKEVDNAPCLNLWQRYYNAEAIKDEAVSSESEKSTRSKPASRYKPKSRDDQKDKAEQSQSKNTMTVEQLDFLTND